MALNRNRGVQPAEDCASHKGWPLQAAGMGQTEALPRRLSGNRSDPARVGREERGLLGHKSLVPRLVRTAPAGYCLRRNSL